MPEVRHIALGAWAAALLGVAWRSGSSHLASALLLGAAPVVGLAALFADVLAPITGLFPKSAMEDARKKTATFYRERSLTLNGGGESLEWLNCLVAQLWPHIAKYVEDLIKGYESKLQGYMPVGGSSVRFKTCSLGKEQLKFGPVKARAVDAVLDNQRIDKNGVELEIDISYNSDVDILLSTPIATVGIADLSVNGTLSIIFRPLLSKSPFIGGMEVLFNNPPEINVDFKGIGNVADMPGIYSAVRRAIDDVIGGIMVSPNRKAFMISGDETVDLAHIKNPRPEGLLRVTVLKADNLEGSDLNFNMTRTSDPYVEVKIGATKWRTPTIRKTCNPIWPEGNVHDFFVYSRAQLVYIDVFDEDQFTDDSLGIVKRCPVHELLRIDEDIVSFPLQQRTNKDHVPPEDARLHMKFTWLRMVPLDTEDVLAEGPNKYVLSFKIDECDGLPEVGLGAPYTLRLSVKGDGKRSLTTAKGWPKYHAQVTPKAVKRIMQLSEGGAQAAAIADMMGLDENSIKALLAAEHPKDAKESEYQKWLTTLQTENSKCEASRNPQFEEVLRLPVATPDVTAVVELVNSAKKPVVVGRFEVQVAKTPLIKGPFVILDPSNGQPLQAGQAKLHGDIHLWALAK